MNHGRPNPPVRFCPGCGMKFQKPAPVSLGCDAEKHAARRKDRQVFCHDCGKDLTATNR